MIKRHCISLFFVLFLSCSDSDKQSTSASYVDSIEKENSKLTHSTKHVDWEIGDVANVNRITELYKLWDDKKSVFRYSIFCGYHSTKHTPGRKECKAWLKSTLCPYIQNTHIQKVKIDIRQVAAEGDKVWTLVRQVAPNGKSLQELRHSLISQAETKTSANKNSMF